MGLETLEGDVVDGIHDTHAKAKKAMTVKFCVPELSYEAEGLPLSVNRLNNHDHAK